MQVLAPSVANVTSKSALSHPQTLRHTHTILESEIRDFGSCVRGTVQRLTSTLTPDTLWVCRALPQSPPVSCSHQHLFVMATIVYGHRQGHTACSFAETTLTPLPKFLTTKNQTKAPELQHNTSDIRPLTQTPNSQIPNPTLNPQTQNVLNTPMPETLNP